MKITTIGFTKKNAGEFFGLIKASGAKRVVDVRLNNVSQLAGFAKRDDLEFFLKEICDVEYVHLPEHDAVATWRDQCLLADGSVFASEEGLWTEPFLDEIDQRFVKNLDAGEGDFLSKLKVQLSAGSPECKKLMAESVWLLLLFPSNVGAKRSARTYARSGRGRTPASMNTTRCLMRKSCRASAQPEPPSTPIGGASWFF